MADREEIERLRECEERYWSLVEGSLHGLIIFQGDPPRPTYVSESAAKIGGISLGEAKRVDAEGFLQFLHPDERESFVENYRSYLSGEKEPVPVVRRILRADGSEGWVMGYASVCRFRGAPAVQIAFQDVTESKEAEARLRDSEIMFRTLVVNANDGILVSDAEGHHLFANERAAEITGYSREELVGMSYRELAHPDYAAKIGETVRKRVAGEPVPRQYETLIVHKDGRVIPVEVTGAKSVWHGEDSDMVILRDITERRRVEEELRESRNLYQSLLELSPDPVCVVQEERVRFLNRVFTETFGYTMEDVDGRPAFLGTIPEETRESVLRYHQDHLRDRGARRNLEMEIIAKDGSRRICEVSSVQVDYEGEPAVLAIVRDVSVERKAKRELEQSQERYKGIVEDQTELVCRYGSDSLFTFVNEACCRFTDRTREELLGRSFLPFLPGEERDWVWGQIAALTPEDPIVTIEQHAVNGEGEVRWMRWTNRAIFDENDVLREYQAVGTDITERKEAEELIRRHGEKLEEEVRRRTVRIEQLERLRAEGEKLAATGRMAARIAHEINNPLGGIKNSFLLIKDAVPEDHPYHSYVARIEKEIDRIARIVRQMYDLHPGSGRSPDLFWVDQTIRDVVLLLERSAGDQDVRIEIDSRLPRLRVHLPEDLVRQVLFNILQNAVEASPPGAVVSVGAATRDGCLVITVEDRGRGVSEDVNERVFEPFFTTKEGRVEGGLGLGLGLSISKSILDALRGTIDLEKRAGGGSVCKVMIPIGEEGVRDE